MWLKRTIPLLICFVVGVSMSVQYFVPTQWSKDGLEELSNWVAIIAGFTIGLGVVSVCRLHWQKIRRLAPGWGYSIVAFIGFFGMVVAGFWFLGIERNPETRNLTPYGWGYVYVMQPLQSTIFSILAFYIASAAFRAFRARSLEATLLLVTAVIVLLGRASVGDWLWERLGGARTGVTLSDIVVWIMSVPNMSAQRGIMFGLTLGILATSLKIIFGIERAYLGGGKD